MASNNGNNKQTKIIALIQISKETIGNDKTAHIPVITKITPTSNQDQFL